MVVVDKGQLELFNSCFLVCVFSLSDKKNDVQVSMVNGYKSTICEEMESNSRLSFKSASWDAEGNKQVYLSHMWVFGKTR